MQIETRLMSLFMALAVVSACGTTRSPAQYREDTHSLLYKSSTRLEACYAKALASNPNVNGTIVVHFVVEPRTGNIVKPTVS